MNNKQQPATNCQLTTGYHSRAGGSADRVTATETIDGVQHLLVLEQDDSGCYREVILEPLGSGSDGLHAALV